MKLLVTLLMLTSSVLVADDNQLVNVNVRTTPAGGLWLDFRLAHLQTCDAIDFTVRYRDDQFRIWSRTQTVTQFVQMGPQGSSYWTASAHIRTGVVTPLSVKSKCKAWESTQELEVQYGTNEIAATPTPSPGQWERPIAADTVIHGDVVLTDNMLVQGYIHAKTAVSGPQASFDSHVAVGGQQVIGARRDAVAPVGPNAPLIEHTRAINQVITRLQSHGLIW